MSAEAGKPDEVVHDGVQDKVDPVPRESQDSPGDGQAGGDAVRDTDEARAPESTGGSDANDPTGPAEEKDDATPDDRGLATELGPSD